MLWVDEKFASLLSSRLDRFKKRGDTYNFRCPFCEDSKKSRSKARGYFLPSTDHLSYFCHNCGTSTSFSKFLRRFDHNLFDEYLYESLKEQGKDVTHFKSKQSQVTNPFRDLPYVSDLPADHDAKAFLVQRQLPPDRFLYSEGFNAFVNSLIPNKIDSPYDEPRVVIPLVTKQGRVIGFQGRSLKPKSTNRYISICLDKDLPMVFGMDKVDFSQRFYVTEGPFDSCFLPNAVAACGANLLHTLERMPVIKDKAVIILDNEPRNRQIVESLEGVIKAGYQVVVWPWEVKEKDINDMVLQGWKPSHIQQTLDQNIHMGMNAQLALSGWRRC